MNIRPDLPLIERVAAELRDMLGDDWDEQTFMDTLDGETDAADIADALLAGMQEDDALAAAIKAQADALAARSKRIAARAAAQKRTLLAVLDATGMRKMERPRGTISRLSGRMSMVITDAASIPSQLTRTRVEPDRDAIKAQLQAGEEVPGAALVRGDDTIRVGVK